jgi:hypothetical protein
VLRRLAWREAVVVVWAAAQPARRRSFQLLGSARYSRPPFMARTACWTRSSISGFFIEAGGFDGYAIEPLLLVDR